jgi:hypothetical protein
MPEAEWCQSGQVWGEQLQLLVDQIVHETAVAGDTMLA